MSENDPTPAAADAEASEGNPTQEGQTADPNEAPVALEKAASQGDVQPSPLDEEKPVPSSPREASEKPAPPLSPEEKSASPSPQRGLSAAFKTAAAAQEKGDTDGSGNLPSPKRGTSFAKPVSAKSAPARNSGAVPARGKDEKGFDRRDTPPTPKAAPLSAANVKGSLWQQVLNDAKTTKVEQRDSYLVMLGSYDVGKSTLLRQLQVLGSVKPLSSTETYTNTGGVSLLDFAYVGQRCLEEEEDVSTVDAHSFASVYILQHPELAGRLAELLPSSALPNLCFLICLDMRQAWCALDEVTKWFRAAENICNTLLAKQDVETQDRLRDKMQRYLATYRRHAMSSGVTRAVTALLDLQNFGSCASTAGEELVKTLEAEKATEASSDMEIPIPAPVVVAVTRSDAYQQLNSRQNLGQIDIMMAYLRRECLKFNAAIVACSCRDERNPRNILLLYRYLMHRLCNCFFKELPATEDVESFFMPSGCDTAEDIEKAVQQTVAGSFEKPFEAWITRHIESKKLDDQANTTVPIQTMQEFLRQMEEQFPAAAVAAKPMGERRVPLLSAIPNASGALGRTESGRRSLQAGSQRLTISIQPSIKSSRAELQPTKTFVSGPGAEGGVEKIRTRAEVPRLLSSTLVTKPSTLPTSSSTISTGGGGAESASLQNFFQGLLAKNKTKVPATPRGRARPKAGPEGEQKKAPGDA
ncbi:dynein light intermediate chain [Toxoplasma gondii RUB]|uniref:Dynein light intermediate chain n=7 Tax=Toxoplasma gondii TaxID=5811 RepID=S7V128_TOXGG|nr:hypothetical protein TGGT1_247600 [Toxoplasma gondii GT1]KAF4638560.1 hypothetical protein TGRH88_061680 [Toxoplasma gondii]KFG64493.1 dynein light intermediate chain [Toxoplasma gondii RUB]RQX72059.1 dynein light intermediate chain [Toxoplasma gondii CAST]